MKLGYIQMGKRLPYYYGKDKEAARKKRYSKRKDIENGLKENENEKVSENIKIRKSK